MKRKPAGSSSGIAFCSSMINPEAPDEIQITPDGPFRALDGRPHDAPHWVMNQANADRVIAAASQRSGKFVVDYEHQTLLAKENGKPAPAAGWFEAKDLVYRPGEGLFARVSWTAAARKLIADEEYRYTSPVIIYRFGTGDVTALFNVALTNTPAVDGMTEVSARRAAASLGFVDKTEEQVVNWKEKLIAMLGLEADADDETIGTKLVALSDRAAEADQIKKDLTKAEERITALSDEGGAPDPSKFVRVEVVDKLREQVAELSEKHVDREVEDLIQAALNDERGPLLLDAQLEWARDLGKRDIASLKTYLDKATPIAALRGRQTARTGRPDESSAALTDEGAEVIAGLGLDVEEFKKTEEVSK